MLPALQYKLCQRAAMRGNMIYGNELTCVAIWSMAMNKITWQMILLPWHNDHSNNVWSLATNKIVWQTVYLPRHNGHGNNTLGNKILAWQYIQLQCCSWQMSIAMLSIVACITSCYEDGCNAPARNTTRGHQTTYINPTNFRKLLKKFSRISLAF